MNNCDRNLSRRFLRDDLTVDEVRQFEIHLETCTQCRLSLEDEAGSRNTWQSMHALLGTSSEVVCWSDLAAQLRLVPHESSFAHEESDSVAIDLSILSPSDDPNSIGRIGTYEVTGVIGRGGMGIVFKVFDRSLGRNAAVKVLDPSLAAFGAARERFAREARAMAAVSHQHVVPVYAVDTHRGLPYFAMEYVPGGTVEARLNQEGPLEVLSVVRISHQVALALAAAHNCGLVHRDIKPANILMDRGIERVRVTDFGLARVSDDASFTRTGLVVGTPQYMAPEQVRGESCDAQSDLFSLGSVMYAMCTGHAPFRAESLYGVMQRIVHDHPRPIREQSPSVPEWLELFIERLLAKRPSDRFDSAVAVARLLETEQAHLQNPLHVAAPERKWMQENRTFRERMTHARPRSTTVVASTSVIVLTIVVWWLWPAATISNQANETRLRVGESVPLDSEVARDVQNEVDRSVSAHLQSDFSRLKADQAQ